MSDNNSDASLMLERAHSAVLSRDYSLATRLYRTLLQSDPDNADLLFALGDLYQKSGNDAKAIPIYKRLIEKNPKDVVSMNFLGSIYRRIKQWDDSIDILEKAVIVDESNIQTFYNLGFTYKLMGRNEEAIQCFNTVVDENPNDVLAYNHIGSIYASENEHDKAVSAYQRGLKIDPNHPILHLNMARSYEKLDSDELASKEYESALRSKPGWLDAIDGYADLLLKKKDIKAVSEMLSQAIRLNPQVASVHTKMGHVYEMQGNYVDAESEYSTSLKINAKDFNSFADLAEVLFKNGKLVDSLRTMKKGDEICGDSDISFMKRYADLMMNADKLNAAGHKIKMLWEKNQDDIDTLNLLGQYYICRGEDAKAEGCLQKIKKLDPTYMEYLVDGARRYNQTKRYAKAEQNLRKYLQTDPNNQRAMVALADCLEKQNRIEEALDEFQKLAALDLDNIFYRSSLERLAQLLENAETEDDYSGDYGMSERDDASESRDSLESQLASADGDGGYDSSAIMPSIDFSNIDQQKMSQAEMVQSRNRGYSFEGLTHEDQSMGSPFSPNVDEEIMASNSVDDFDSLVPEPEKEPDDSNGFMQSLPSNGTGMGNGPVEGIMSDKFMEEDIGGNKKVPTRTLDVSDGWDDGDDGFDQKESASGAQRSGDSKPRPAPKSAPQDDSDGPVDSTDESSDGFDFAMEESTEDVGQETVPSNAPDVSAEEVDGELEIEGDNDIFDSEDEEPSGDMDFSAEELVEDSEIPVDQIADGADSGDDVDNGYGFSFEDDDGSEVFGDDGPSTENSGDTSSDDDGFDFVTEPESVADEAVPVDSASQSPAPVDSMDTDYSSDSLDAGSDATGSSGFGSDHAVSGGNAFAGGDSIEDVPSEDVSVDADTTVYEPADDSMEAVSAESALTESVSTESDGSFAAGGETDDGTALDGGDELRLSADLFIKLKDLSSYLPFDKKQKFLESRENLLLEYLIKKLSGEAGLLETAHDIRERLNISDDESFEIDAERTRSILRYMKSYIESLPDRNIAKSLEDEVDSAIEKL